MRHVSGSSFGTRVHYLDAFIQRLVASACVASLEVMAAPGQPAPKGGGGCKTHLSKAKTVRQRSTINAFSGSNATRVFWWVAVQLRKLGKLLSRVAVCLRGRPLGDMAAVNNISQCKTGICSASSVSCAQRERHVARVLLEPSVHVKR